MSRSTGSYSWRPKDFTFCAYERKRTPRTRGTSMGGLQPRNVRYVCPASECQQSPGPGEHRTFILQGMLRCVSQWFKHVAYPTAYAAPLPSPSSLASPQPRPSFYRTVALHYLNTNCSRSAIIQSSVSNGLRCGGGHTVNGFKHFHGVSISELHGGS